MGAPSRHSLVLVALLAATLPGVAACGTISTGSPVVTTPPPTPTPTATPTATTTPRSAAPSPSGYPTTARAYAEAVLTAWSQRLIGALGDLATTAARDQIVALPGDTDPRWTYERCDSASGSAYCAFTNSDGDVITLRILDAQLGAAHAATEVKFDRTGYASGAPDYVTAFLDAWRTANTRRMLALSNQAEVDYFSRQPPPERYQLCQRGAGAAVDVRIDAAAGPDYLVRVEPTALGHPHAILSHGDPGTAC